MEVPDAALRRARPADVAGMRRVRGAVRENRLVSTLLTEADYLRAIGEEGRGWVVEVGVEIVGFAVARETDGNLWALFVDPRHEGRGLGRRLHDAAIGWLRARGLARSWLTTEAGTRAQRFYEAAGWRRVEGSQDGELRFELELR